MAKPPTSQLYDLVLDLKWSQIEKHVLRYPLDSQYRGTDANETPLYLALEIGFPPLTTVQALLKAYPEAATLPQTKNRDLPIHLVCRFGQTEIKYAVIQTLLLQQVKNIPPSIHANARSRYGNTPLSALTDSFVSWHSEASIQSRERAKKQHWKCVHLVLLAACGHMDNIHVPNDTHTNTRMFLPLHSVLKLGRTHDCPHPIVMLVIEMCHSRHFTLPYDMVEEHHHQKQQLPIHIAITNARTAFKTQEDYHSVLCAILDRCPTAASIKDPFTGSYPLHMVLLVSCQATATSSNCLSTNLASSQRKRPAMPWEPVIRKLCMAFPDAMEQQDIHTNLFPFMMVAVSAANDCNEEAYHDMTTLTAVYKLLQMKPHVLIHCYS